MIVKSSWTFNSSSTAHLDRQVPGPGAGDRQLGSPPPEGDHAGGAQPVALAVLLQLQHSLVLLSSIT